MRRDPPASVLAALLIAGIGVAPAVALPHRTATPRVWYVDNAAAGGGDGSMVAPFDRLSRAERAADEGDSIYVFRGDGTSRGLAEGIRLRPYQRLVGSGTPFTPEGAQPLPAGEPPPLEGGSGAAVVLADHSSVEGFAVSGGDAVVVLGRGVRDVRLVALHVDGRDTARVGIALDHVSGVAMEGVTVERTRSHGIELDAVSQTSLRASRVSAAGSQEGDAALLVREPSGLLEITGCELSARRGAALAVTATGGEARLDIAQTSLAADAAASDPVLGLAVVAAGEAELSVFATAALLERLRGEGIRLLAEGHGRLRFELAGSGIARDDTAAPASALSAMARQTGSIEVVARGNELSARDTSMLLSASGQGRLQAELDTNAIGSGAARGVVMLVSDEAQGLVTLTGNRIAALRAESVYAVAAASARLTVDGRGNTLVGSLVPNGTRYPALLVETRDGGRACLALTDNHIGNGAGGGPAIALRQLGSSALALSGFGPPPTPEAGPAQRLGATNVIGRVEIELVPGGALAAPASLPCPAGVLAATPTVGQR